MAPEPKALSVPEREFVVADFDHTITPDSFLGTITITTTAGSL